MKKESKNNKKLLAIGLAALCVCLVVGLFYYLGGMGGKLSGPEVIDTPQQDNPASVAEITPPESVPATIPAPSEVQTPQADEAGRSDRPKSPEEAVPPEPPQVENEDDLKNPEQPPEYTPEQTQPSANTPQGGDTNGNGQVWVPGFGWVTPSGEPNTQGTAPNAGTGDPVGDM